MCVCFNGAQDNPPPNSPILAYTQIDKNSVFQLMLKCVKNHIHYYLNYTYAKANQILADLIFLFFWFLKILSKLMKMMAPKVYKPK